jgi:uncharacterized protein (DUF362 family)
MTAEELLTDLRQITHSLTATKPYLSGTRFLKGFEQHIENVTSESIKVEQRGVSIERSIQRGIGIVLYMLEEDLTKLIPKLKSPWKDSMVALKEHVSILQSKIRSHTKNVTS